MVTALAEAGGFTFTPDMFAPIITLVVQGVGVVITGGISIMAISVAIDFVLKKFKKVAK